MHGTPVPTKASNWPPTAKNNKRRSYAPSHPRERGKPFSLLAGDTLSNFYCPLIRAEGLKIISVWKTGGDGGHVNHISDENLSLQSPFLGNGGWGFDLRPPRSVFLGLRSNLDNSSRDRREIGICVTPLRSPIPLK